MLSRSVVLGRFSTEHTEHTGQYRAQGISYVYIAVTLPIFTEVSSDLRSQLRTRIRSIHSYVLLSLSCPGYLSLTKEPTLTVPLWSGVLHYGAVAALVILADFIYNDFLIAQRSFLVIIDTKLYSKDATVSSSVISLEHRSATDCSLPEMRAALSNLERSWGCSEILVKTCRRRELLHHSLSHGQKKLSSISSRSSCREFLPIFVLV